MNIGDVVITRESATNPYHEGESLMGDERAELLARWRCGTPTPGFVFWYAPACGGARKLNSVPAELEMVRTWTTAPESYDGFGTETIRIAGRSCSKPVREVATPVCHAEWQRMRYHSGAVYLVADEAKWQKLIEYELVEVTS